MNFTNFQSVPYYVLQPKLKHYKGFSTLAYSGEDFNQIAVVESPDR